MWTRRLLFILPLAIFLIAGAFFLWGLDPERDPSAIPSALIDRPAPEFALSPIEGTEGPGLSTADLAGEGVTLVNFFASWCLPCRAEHPLLVRLSQEDGVRIVGINYKDKPEEARKWLEELGDPYARIGADQDGRAAIEWGVTGVPETFIVDAQGRIRYRHIGPIHPNQLENEVQPRLQALRQ